LPHKVRECFAQESPVLFITTDPPHKCHVDLPCPPTLEMPR
jgi:hypothetical protein